MWITLVGLVGCYSGLMMVAALATWRDAPIANLMMLVGALTLIAGLRWYFLVPSGLVILAVVAVVNGVHRYHQVHWRHFMIRCVVSIVILALATALRY